MKLFKSKPGMWMTVFFACLIPVIVYSYSEGPIAGVTGGFGEPTCNQGGCHVGTPVNGGGGSVTISAPDTYTTGTTYPISVTVSDPKQSRWGFELAVRSQASGKQAGNLIRGTDGFTQLLPSSGIIYIEHTLPGTRPRTANGATFTFSWTAPDTSAGPVIFNAAGNAANNSNSETGDHIYTAAKTSQPQVAGPTPIVADGAVVNSASFALHPAPMAPGSMATIFGSNLSDGSTAPSGSFGADGKLITTLAGTQVKINGTSVPIFYSSPSQVSFQLPMDLTSTSAQIEVTVAGQTSAPPRTIFIDTAAPGIFTISADGKGQGAVLVANSTILAAPAGSVPGARPAKPGEFITIFCTGLGTTNPPLATGAPSTGNPTTATATATVDGIPVPVSFSGGAPGFVGLYQINLQIPANTRTASNIPIVISIGGKQSNTATIAVGP